MFSKLIQSNNGNTALIEACERGHVETARVLLDHGAATDYRNKVKSTVAERDTAAAAQATVG
jgi:ankyrin repeat protein